MDKDFPSLNNFGNNGSTNNMDLLSIINNDNPIDLFAIQANKILNDIKEMIGKNLDSKKAEKIDNYFKKSLKEVLIVNKNEITDDYLKELSYIYYALYNGTLDVYYDIRRKKNSIDYYMLDEKFYNSINETETIAWENYKCQELLKKAYNNDWIDELLSILNINPYFSFYCSEELSKDYFKTIIDTFGKELVAKSNFSHIEYAFKNNQVEYVKQLISINPEIAVNNNCIFDEEIKRIFDINEIAFFTEENKSDLDYIIYDRWDGSGRNELSENLFKYYKELIQLKPDFNFYDSYRAKKLLTLISEKKISLPASLYVQLSDDEHDKLYDLRYNYENADLKLKVHGQLVTYIQKLKRQYLEPKQKTR